MKNVNYLITLLEIPVKSEFDKVALLAISLMVSPNKLGLVLTNKKVPSPANTKNPNKINNQVKMVVNHFNR